MSSLSIIDKYYLDHVNEHGMFILPISLRGVSRIVETDTELRQRTHVCPGGGLLGKGTDGAVRTKN